MSEPSEANREPRLEAWMQARVEQAMTPPDDAIPRELMWARIAPSRRVIVDAPSPARATGWMRVAAGVAVGVALGRVAWPTRHVEPAATSSRVASAMPTGAGAAPAPASLPTGQPASVAPREPSTSADTGPGDARIRSAPVATIGGRARRPASAHGSRTLTLTPAVTAHLQATVALLASIRDPQTLADGDSLAQQRAHRLLSTTRELLDAPELRASGTHRLLQDLELVLAQLARARTAAPATRAAASETLRETRLLPRLRAATGEARNGSEEP